MFDKVNNKTADISLIEMQPKRTIYQPLCKVCWFHFFTFSQISIADSFWQRLEALDDSADMECEFRINLINFFKDKSSWVYRTWFAHGCMKIAPLVHNFRKYLPALKLDFSCCFANCTSKQVQYYEENRFCNLYIHQHNYWYQNF